MKTKLELSKYSDNEILSYLQDAWGVSIKKENLCDNMSNLELVLNMLAEASTTEISKEKQPEGLAENRDITKKGGNAAKQAHLEIEKQTGKPIVTPANVKNILDGSEIDGG